MGLRVRSRQLHGGDACQITEGPRVSKAQQEESTFGGQEEEQEQHGPQTGEHGRCYDHGHTENVDIWIYFGSLFCTQVATIFNMIQHTQVLHGPIVGRQWSQATLLRTAT